MIADILEHIRWDSRIKSALPMKPTARCPERFICEHDGKEFLVVIATTDIQKFYLKRSIHMQEEFFPEFHECFVFNMPILYGELMNEFYVIYEYFNNLKWSKKTLSPVRRLQSIHKKFATSYEMTPDIFRRIQDDFLSAWPESFHEAIKSLDLFNDYFDEVRKMGMVTIFKEHGDFTANNVLRNKDEFWLMDFEFARSFQIIGFDIFDYFRTNSNSILCKILCWMLDVGCWMSGMNWRIQSTTSLMNRQLRAKSELVDAGNIIVDKAHMPAVDYAPNESVLEVSPNFIYNRFDLIFGDDFQMFHIKDARQSHYIPMHRSGADVMLGVWMTDISPLAFSMLIKKVFDDYPDVEKIETRYSLNFHNGLLISNHWNMTLTDTIAEFDAGLSKKTQFNVKYYPRLIYRELGAFQILKYSRMDIPDDVVIEYFKFKMLTHCSDYRLTATEYLRSFHVSDAYVMEINNKFEAMLFLCDIGTDIVYVENLSYNPALGRYGLGMVLWHYMIADMIDNGKKVIFLGDGEQEYKRRYRGQNRLVFDGNIVRKQ